MLCLFLSESCRFMVTYAHMHSFHCLTHTHEQLGSCKIPVKEVQWLMWKYRNKWNQSELIRNGSSIQQESEQTQETCPQVDKDAAYILITAATCHAVYTVCFTASLCSVCKCLPRAKDDEQWLSWENSWTMIYRYSLWKYLHAALAAAGPEAHMKKNIYSVFTA